MEVTVERTCSLCGKPSSVTVEREAYNRWAAGEFAQTAFPNLSADQREIVISGTHPACWEQMFGVEWE